MTGFTSRGVTLSTEVLIQDFGGEAVLLDLASESYFGLDQVGTRIWQLLGEHGDLEQAARAFLDEYDVDETRFMKDLTDFVAELSEAGLLTLEADVEGQTKD